MLAYWTSVPTSVFALSMRSEVTATAATSSYTGLGSACRTKKRKLRKLNTTEKVYIWFKELEYKVFSLIRVTQIEISVTKMLFYAR